MTKLKRWTYLSGADGDLADNDPAMDARADELARRINSIESARERESWAVDYWEGDPGPDLDDCEQCSGRGVLPTTEADAKCTHPDCDGGWDMGPVRRAQERKWAKQAAQDVELDWLNAQLNAIGRRMMRPYEHHNEHEKYYEYMENR